ncbi:MAG: acetyltransferase [Pseudomonadota bacterium]|nr:acetyltransferase [Pseudomonadota bacterium]
MPSPPIIEWTTTDGTHLRLRPARPDDTARVHRALALVSPEARRQRLLATTKGFSEEFVSSLVDGDPARQFAVLVVREEDGEEIPVAGGRLVQNEPSVDGKAGKKDGGACEFALTVGDRWQGQGVGKNIVYALIAEARHRKLRTMVGHILSDNRAMLTLARHLHFFIETSPGDDTCTAILDLDAPVVRQALAGWLKRAHQRHAEDKAYSPPGNRLRITLTGAALLLAAAVVWHLAG